MRKAVTISEPNKAPKVIIDNYGTTSMLNFAQILFNAGKLDYKNYISSKRFAFTNEFATRLLNENLNLFPAQF